jgi:Fe-S oxidoreductase
MEGKKSYIPTMAEMVSGGEAPEILLWIGCAGSFDARYQKVIKSFIAVLHQAAVHFAVLGPEERCTGDPAKRAGNEFLFQLQALSNIKILNGYGIKKIVTACPHCFNTLKNEYKSLGGNYEVFHHTEYLLYLISEGRLKPSESLNEKVVYHDSCYLGRGNQIYNEPRNILKSMKLSLSEMPRSGSSSLCCGAGGGQMFKESEPGLKEINVERTTEAVKTGARTIATACPFCMSMFLDGLKNLEKEDILVMDIVELLEKSVSDSAGKT